MTTNFPETIEELELLINKGEKRAYLQLAFLYEKQNDVQNANKYFKLGAESGEKDAQFFYALRLENGINTDINYEEANKYYKLSADQKNGDAALRYAMNLAEGSGIEANESEARRYFKLAKEIEELEKGESAQSDPNSISSIQKRALQDKDPEAMLLCGFYYSDPDNQLSYDIEKAHEFYKMSADAGNAQAQFMYGVILFYGVDIEAANPEEGLIYIQKAADGGNSDAIHFINSLNEKPKQEQQPKNPSTHHLNGFEGLPENDIEALERIVQEEGNTFAMIRLSILYENLERFEEAFSMLKMSSDKGNPNAQFLYGMRKEFGINTPIDLTEANIYYKKSAIQGNEDASYRLAVNLLHGNGIEKNEKEAMTYLKISAELGNKDAMILYAANLKDGVGIDPDPALAEKYMKSAFGLKD